MKGRALAVFLILGFLLGFSGLAEAQFGSISGRFTDEVTGIPIAEAHVQARGDTCHGGGCGGAMTDSAGFYEITHLHPGTYLVFASAAGYADEAYPDSVMVVAGQNTPHINFTMTPQGGGGTGSISGMVTDEITGNPIIMAEVRLSGMHHDVWYTDTAGLYTCDEVPAGVYLVGVHANGYYPETYPDSIVVTQGQNTPGIDFALTPAGGETGSISGMVTDAETGLPIATAHVWAYGDSGHHCCGGEAWTDSVGYYLISDLTPGQYLVGVHKCGYQDAVYPESVTVVEGQITPNVDFVLTPIGEPGSISGTVTDSMTGEPISCAHIWAYGELSHAQARTDSLGQYTIHGLYAGSYFVTVWASDYYPQEYPDTVMVIEGQNTSNIDFTLVTYDSPAQGMIAGQVLSDSALDPVPYAVVFALSTGGNWRFGFTDSMGSYTIGELETDNYYVYACAPGYIGEFYDGVYTWEEATLVTPDAYNVNFQLGTCGSAGGNISGVISSNGSPLEDAFVYAMASGEVRGFARSSTDGGYVLNGLLPGTYTVVASKVMYHDGSYPDPVQVVIGKVGGIDVNLPAIKVGDVTGEGSIDVGDVVFLINYLYRSGAEPDPLMIGDLNCDGNVEVGDVVYMINYLFRGGPAPCSG